MGITTEDRMAARRLATMAASMQQEIKVIAETASPEIIAALFGSEHPFILVADLGAIIANADRVLTQQGERH